MQAIVVVAIRSLGGGTKRSVPMQEILRRWNIQNTSAYFLLVLFVPALPFLLYPAAERANRNRIRIEPATKQHRTKNEPEWERKRTGRAVDGQLKGCLVLKKLYS